MAIELIDKIKPKNDAFTGMVDANQVIGGSNLPSDVGHAEWDIAYTHSQTTSGNPHSVTKDDVGLGNVTNDAQIPLSQKGVANGVAELDSSGTVPSSQLPSYVDDVLEYATQGDFPATGETGKIYVAQDTNLTYRWSGSAYVEISQSLALGETSSTAYRGDRGKTAYDHSQLTSGNPHNVTLADVGGTTDHTELTNIGTNTHTQIDAHIADTNKHIDWTNASDNFKTSGSASIADDTDTTSYIGRAKIGGPFTDTAQFSHRDLGTATASGSADYGVAHASDGTLYINAKTYIYLKRLGVTKVTVADTEMDIAVRTKFSGGTKSSNGNNGVTQTISVDGNDTLQLVVEDGLIVDYTVGEVSS